MNDRTWAMAFCCAAFLLSSGSMPANSETPPGSLTVRYRDLDLSRQQDAFALYDRIKKAAVQACKPYDSRSSYEQERFADCVKVAIARAVDSVGKQPLYAVYQIKTGAALAPWLAALERR